MSSISGVSGGPQGNWYTRYSKQSATAAKPGQMDKFGRFTQEAVEAELNKLREPLGNRPPLTDVQIQELAAKYDPTAMSPEQYEAFVDDLCNMGVLDESDKELVDCGIGVGPHRLTRLKAVTAVSVQDANNALHGTYFIPDNGDILGWARYRTTFRTYAPGNSTGFYGRDSQLFGKIADILARINDKK